MLSQNRVELPFFYNIGTEVIYTYKAVLQFLPYGRHISRGRIKNCSKIIISKISAGKKTTPFEIVFVG